MISRLRIISFFGFCFFAFVQVVLFPYLHLPGFLCTSRRGRGKREREEDLQFAIFACWLGVEFYALLVVIMQRRALRHHVNGSSTTALPLRSRNDDYPHHSRASSNSTHRKKISKRAMIISITIVLSIALLAGFIVWESIVSFVGSRNNSLSENTADADVSLNRRQLDKTHFYESRPLDRFSELKYALGNSKIMLLYFAASWCPMSTPISEALDEAFGRGDMLLTRNGEKKTLSIVYVSSDETLKEYNEYTLKRHWLPIPFDSPEKNALKRHFATCAHVELEELHFDRKHELPTIVVIDSKTQGIITTNGAHDVEEMGDGALEHWLEMQSWASRFANSI